jgi:hypothetical protein
LINHRIFACLPGVDVTGNHTGAKQARRSG